MANELFLDTAYAIALASASDALHARAVAVAEMLETGAARLITTRAVMLEIGNALSRLRYRPAAVRILGALEHDADVDIVVLFEPLYARAMQLYRERPDKEWGLTDRISFLVMRERGIHRALTADEHFQQAGFRAILRENAPL